MHWILLALFALEIEYPQVIDGMTLAGDPNIRIWGIDAPEADEPGGAEATARLSDLLSGESLTCEEKDAEISGHMVAQCFMSDGRDIACEMVKTGHARDWPKHSKGHYASCS